MTGSSNWLLVKHMYYAWVIGTKFVHREGKMKERGRD